MSVLEPSRIEHGERVFTVHYLDTRKSDQPDAPAWIAFTLVVRHQGNGKLYPAEYFDLGPDQQPPGIDGSGATHEAAYADLRVRLSEALQQCGEPAGLG